MDKMIICLDGSFVGIWGSVADTAGVSSGKSDETILSPWAGPWVLHFPVVIWHSNKENTVVQTSSTVAEHTARISRPVGSITSHGNGSSGQSVGQVIAALDVGEAGDLERSAVGLAGLLDGFVGVFSFSDNSIISDIFESIVHQTTIAGHVTVLSWAVDQLLFGEGLEGAIGEFAQTLKTTGGGESPAWSTVSLVLHGGDSTLSNPVDVVGDGDFLISLDDVFGGDDGSEVALDELFLSHGSELIDSFVIGSVLVAVVELDFLKVFKEDLLSVGFFEHGVELHIEFLFPLLELGEFRLGFHPSEEGSQDANNCQQEG